MARLGKKRKKQKLCQEMQTHYKYFKTSWSVQTKEFFDNCSLHGVKYIAEVDRPFFERFMWFVCVAIGTVATCVVIFSLWEKFQTNPTITGLDTDFHNWEVPFPAVTLCQEIPASLERIRRILGISENDTLEDEEKTKFFYDLTRLTLNSLSEFVRKYPQNTFLHEGKNIREFIFKFMNDCNELFGECKFKDEKLDCCTHGFFPVFTEIGYCLTFNSRHFEKNTLGRSQEVPQFNMQYIKETDVKWSLEFALRDVDVLTPIYILNSDEMLGIDVHPQHVWDFKVNRMSFSVKQTYTTEDTRQLSIKQRRCVFEDEIKLKVDHMYTYTACAIECRMENAKSICGCIPYFYPNIPDFPYCTMDEMVCIANHLEKIKMIDRCNCQLGCKNTVYEVEKLNMATNDENKGMETEFVSWPMVRYKREVLFGWVDLLVSFGGIAGLFLGFSLLSGVEILYYFIIRACFAAVRERKDLDRIRKENENKPKPNYDLGLVPYFISEPIPGQGFDEVAKRYKAKRFGLGNMTKRNNKIKQVKPGKHLEKWVVANTIIPPFGIEFVH